MIATRQAALKSLMAVIQDKRPLTDSLTAYQTHPERSLISELAHGVCRYYDCLMAIQEKLVRKPLKAKDLDVQLAILIGLYQLKYLNVKKFVAVNETVKLAANLKKTWAKGLINAVLRNYEREAKAIEAELAGNLSYRYAHPEWLIELMNGQGLDAEPILIANNQPAPIYLRINQQHISAEQYLGLLNDAEINAAQSTYLNNAIELKTKVDVTQLPLFQEGHVFVQDMAAQMATDLLDLSDGQRVLDACSAPGGKLTGILQSGYAFESVTALDNHSKRIERIHQNLQRLKLKADVVEGDALSPDPWWDGKPFDRILIDAPCSALGVIRRHPDIKLLRTPEAIEEIMKRQQAILEGLWPLLKKGGRLVYVTCSILPQENEQQLAQFIAHHSDAKALEISLPLGEARSIGWQIYPGPSDGFYYGVLKKV